MVEQTTGFDRELALNAIEQAIVKIERVMETMPPFSAKRYEWQDKLACLHSWRRRLERPE